MHRIIGLKMWTLIGAFCLILGLADSQPASSCSDLDTNACVLFHSAKPDLCDDPSFGASACARFCGNCPIECYSCRTPVLDPNDCNTTSTCDADETCILKHLAAIDGHDEYIMACEKKTICEGAGLGFNFGRRRDVDAVEEERINKRDVSLSCCHTDFCNFPVQTTTLPPTTTTMRSPCAKDVVFVLDDSGSVGVTNFKEGLSFVHQLVQQLAIGPNDAKVSLLTYSTHAHVEWDLNKYDTQSAVLNAMNQVHYYVGGTTHTEEALNTVRTQILSPSGGDRPTHDNVVILLSDGVSTNKQQALQAAHELYRESHDVITILVGTSSASEAQMTAIATDGHHAFDLRYYNQLTTIVQQVLSLICRS